MTPSRIENKLRGECSFHTPIRVVLSTKKLGRSHFLIDPAKLPNITRKVATRTDFWHSVVKSRTTPYIRLELGYLPISWCWYVMSNSPLFNSTTVQLIILYGRCDSFLCTHRTKAFGSKKNLLTYCRVLHGYTFLVKNVIHKDLNMYCIVEFIARVCIELLWVE
jgi:hypothetical protein